MKKYLKREGEWEKICDFNDKRYEVVGKCDDTLIIKDGEGREEIWKEKVKLWY